MQVIKMNPAGNRRRGVAAVECAVVLPLFLTLLLGSVEIGTALRASTILQSAVREGGRLASMDWRYVVEDGDTPNEKVERDIRNLVSASGLPGEDLTVSITFGEGGSAGQDFDISDPDNNLDLMLIEVELPYSSISLFPVRHMSGTSVRAGLYSRCGIAGGALTN